MIDKNKLQGAIKSAGFTQAVLAKKLGMSENTFSSKVNGKSYFDTYQVYNLCAILGIKSNKEKVDIFLPESSHFRDSTA